MAANHSLAVDASAADLALADWVLVLLMGVTSVVTVAGNLIVLLSYYLDKNIRHPSNYFIFSLAISDLIIGLEGIPVYTFFFVKEQHWPFGAFLCDLWLSIDYSCCLASIYTVLGITIDRYCSVKYPAAYRNWRTQPKVLLIIAATWIIPSVLFSVSIFGYGTFSGKGRILKEDECYVQFMTDPYLNMSMYISYYWSTLFVMLYLYYGIYKAAKALAVKNDQKQKRLAILSEMRKTKTEKEPQSTAGGAASEAALSNSAVESQPDTSDSVYSRTNAKTANGKFVKKEENNNNVIPYDSANAKPGKVTTEKSVDKMAELSTVQEPSISVSIMPVEQDEVSLAFSIVEEIPFIDDGNTATKSFIKRAKTPIPLAEFQHSNKTPSPSPTSPSAAPSPSSPELQHTPHAPLQPVRRAPDPPVRRAPRGGTPQSESRPLADRSPLSEHRHELPNDQNNNSSSNEPAQNHGNQASRTRPSMVGRIRRFATDRPSTLTSMDSPPMSTTNTFASLSVVVEKPAHGPITMRRLLTVMRHNTTSYRTRKPRKPPAQKSVQSKSENRARKALRTITFILGSFTVLWTPFYVLATIYGFCDRCKESYGFNLLYAISYYLCYMNSPLNPICYAFANQQFKRAFKRILRGDFRRT